MEKKLLDGLLENSIVSDYIYFKYAVLISINVEQSFSWYKNLPAPNQRLFDFKHLKKYV